MLSGWLFNDISCLKVLVSSNGTIPHNYRHEPRQNGWTH